jgi:hypothetical protein
LAGRLAGWSAVGWSAVGWSAVSGRLVMVSSRWFACGMRRGGVPMLRESAGKLAAGGVLRAVSVETGGKSASCDILALVS